MQVIKEVRVFGDLKLNVARDIVDSANSSMPPTLASGLDATQAQRLADTITGAGALVEIRPPIRTTAGQESPPDPPMLSVGAICGVYLVEIGPKKIQVIDEVRSIADVKLAAAKDLVEDSTRKPQLLVGGLTHRDAQNKADRLKRAGAKAEIRLSSRTVT